MKNKKNPPVNTRRGNDTRIDPKADVSSAYQTQPITSNNTPPKINQPPVIPEENVIRAKHWVDENKL